MTRTPVPDRPGRRAVRPDHTAHDGTVERADVVIVGARCAGAATALLLARAGLDVVVLDRAEAGSDTLSTHALMRGGVLQLHRWGVLDAIVAAGTPAVRRTTFHYGDDVTRVTIKPAAGVDALYAPRRTVLDRVLVTAAARAGARVRFGTAVTGLVRTDSGRVAGITGRDLTTGGPLTVRARVVVGADGVRSTVARAVDAPVVHLGGAGSGVVYARWRDTGIDGYEWHYRPGGAAGAIPTNDGETCVFVAGPPGAVRAATVDDVPGGTRRLLGAVAPDLAARLDVARPPAGYRWYPGHPSLIRRPHGPGWALVGDAGHYQDPITAHGMTDALRDAELLTRALVAAHADPAGEARHLADYARRRDELSAPVVAATDAVARYDWDLPTVRRALLELSSAMSAETEALLALDGTEVAAAVAR